MIINTDAEEPPLVKIIRLFCGWPSERVFSNQILQINYTRRNLCGNYIQYDYNEFERLFHKYCNSWKLFLDKCICNWSKHWNFNSIQKEEK